ncbi:peroxisome assembly protein 26 isoform X1 [Brienomyrus brachyistius]|uniref:peroxisome assembly protein 26 isoform X1 n=1 Tax=Brienomyrus brachyistius TaxID=42636 RepID=UPI0020B287CC|nr:peroxisome assembly protein 26 isoform X1 [Brienomyrus brachyistius]
MRNYSSASLVRVRSTGSVPLGSPSLCWGPSNILGLLDCAAEQLMVLREFQSSLDTCERGLESLGGLGELEDGGMKYAELKSAFCIVGIQALAELNKWQGVLCWVLQYYGKPEKLPAKILQMCILLYRKVGEPATMQEATSHWLNYPANSSVPGFGPVAELYLLHILLPCGRLAEAKELVLGPVGNLAFGEDQRKAALEMVENQRRYTPPPTPSSTLSSTLAPSIGTIPQRGSVSPRLGAVLRLLHQGLIVARAHLQSLPIQRALLAAFLLYLLLVRVDPAALSTAFPWISNLLRTLRHMWAAMFGPYHRSR